MRDILSSTSAAPSSQGAMSLSVCTVCGSAALVPSWKIGAYCLSRCERCTHLFVSTGLVSGELNESYERDYYVSGGSETRAGYENYLANAEQRLRGFKQSLHELERHIGSRGRALDFGCAVGLFVKVAADAGWDAVGVERSVWAAEYGRKHYGLNIVSGSEIECVNYNHQFDLITMWDVLEHLEEPRSVLEQAARWLKPGGARQCGGQRVDGCQPGLHRQADGHHAQPVVAQRLHRDAKR